jgi:hypothetical protein
MKKTLLFAALLCGATLFAQDDDVHFAEEGDFEVFKHDVKAGVSLIASQPSIEVNYEYLNSELFTFGLYGSVGLDPIGVQNNVFKENFSIMPYARYYLGFDMDSTADGTYAEGFGRIMFGENQLFDYELMQNYTENVSKISVGAGIGKKYLFDSFIVDGLLGAGYILNNGKAEDVDRVFFRINLLFGYRF